MDDAKKDSSRAGGSLLGMAYARPVLGAVRAGTIVGRGEDAVVAPDDQFTVTLNHKASAADAQYVAHPIDAKLRGAGPDQKLRSIPIVVAYNSPDLSISERYAAYDADGRVVCQGNGACADRVAEGVLSRVACPGASVCEFGRALGCRGQFRFVFGIEGSETGPLENGLFVLRSNSVHAASEIRAQLEYLRGFFGSLYGLPLSLCLEQKSGAGSMDEVFWHPTIRVRYANTLAQAGQMKRDEMERASAGIDIDGAERALLALPRFGDLADDLYFHAVQGSARATESGRTGLASSGVPSSAAAAFCEAGAAISSAITSSASVTAGGRPVAEPSKEPQVDAVEPSELTAAHDTRIGGAEGIASSPVVTLADDAAVSASDSSVVQPSASAQVEPKHGNVEAALPTERVNGAAPRKAALPRGAARRSSPTPVARAANAASASGGAVDVPVADAVQGPASSDSMSFVHSILRAGADLKLELPHAPSAPVDGLAILGSLVGLEKT